MKTPQGTVSTRAKRLAEQGKIQARPRGGAYPRGKALAQPEGPPAMTFVAVPEIQEILRIVKGLQARVVSLEDTRVAPALPAPPAPPATPTAPAVERQHVVQWTIRLSQALIEDLKRMAYEERLNPSELVERLLRQALSDMKNTTGN
jgi:hypothetical protein